MAINWNLYNTRLNINGSSNRERNLKCLQNTITNKLPDSLSYKSVKINNVDASIEIVKTTKDYIKVIHSLPNESFDCGDYVLFYNKTYLITEIDADDDVYTSGKMQECTFVIKFQSPDGTILSYPCIDETTNSVGIDETNTINTLNGIHRIKLPFDDNTKLIKEDRRFFVSRAGTSTYKVTNVNDTEFSYGDKGLIVLTLQADSAYNSQTDINGVCNYFEPTIPPEEPEEGETYSTINSSGQLTIDRTRTIIATTYNADGSVNSGVSLVWVITKPTGYENDITCTVVGNTCTVEIKENYDLIDLVVKFEVSDGNVGYIGSKEFMIGV
jgi:hypothetical protein